MNALLALVFGAAFAAPVQPVSVPLGPRYDLDLVPGGVAELHGPVEWSAAWNPDAIAISGVIGVPLRGTASTVYICTSGGAQLPERGGAVALEGELVYTDGRTQPLKWIVGSQIWPLMAGLTGRGADAVVIGSGLGGSGAEVPIWTASVPIRTASVPIWTASVPIWTASVATIPVVYPDAPLAELRLRPRLPGTALLAVSLSGGSALTGQIVREAHGPAPGPVPGWYPFAIPGLLDAPLPAPPAALPDLPTGPRGFLTIHDGHLAWSTPAGPERARFWGVNLVGRAALPDPALAAGFARSLANAGVNLVRLHHLDFDGEGSIVNPRRGEPGQPPTMPEALDRLDRFTAALGAAGIAQELGLLTLRSFRAGEGVSAPEGVPGLHKYVGAFEPDWLEAEEAWAAALWGRRNPYTGLRYADDPHVALVELANENSLLAGWTSGNLEKLPAVHRGRLDTRWNAWLRRRYPGGDGAIAAAWGGGNHAIAAAWGGGNHAIAAAWGGGNHTGLAPGEALVLDSVAREPSARARAELYPARRVADLIRFYTELQGAYEAELARFVRDDLGFHVPLVCNSTLGIPVADALAGACDVIDVHAYWDPIAEESVFDDVPLTRDAGRARILEKLGACQVGHPCILGEVNHSWPNRHGQEAPLVWATLAARQDLDAVVWFAYRHDTLRAAPDGPDGALDLEGRFHVWAQFPVAAALFRGALVVPATASFVRWWSDEGLLREVAGPPPLRVDAAVAPVSYLRQRVRSAFGPPPEPGGAGGDLDQGDLDQGGVDQGGVDQGGVSWSGSTFLVDRPEVQVVIAGSADGGAGLPEPRATSRLATRLRSFAAVTWASLTARPLADAPASVLIAAGRGERAGTLWGDAGLLVPGRGPFRMETLVGRIYLRLEGAWRVWALDSRGARALSVRRGRLSREERRALCGGEPCGDWWALDADRVRPWVEIRAPGREATADPR